jgi:hypothetical protein
MSGGMSEKIAEFKGVWWRLEYEQNSDLERHYGACSRRLIQKVQVQGTKNYIYRFQWERGKKCRGKTRIHEHNNGRNIQVKNSSMFLA